MSGDPAQPSRPSGEPAPPTTARDDGPAAAASPVVRGFPIVGIGASAGGLSAFEQFFSGMPTDADPGMAFVLVQHLAPDHKSILSELIRRYTRMQVFEVEDGMTVQPNCAYIIPPGRDMAFFNGTLQLLEPTAPRGQRMPIDFFFRSLAHDQRERAIAVVLSGTGSDGTLGVRTIKGEAGMVMAQTPSSTEFHGMPSSAIATGLVDYELAPADMPAQLIAYATHAFVKLPSLAIRTAPKSEGALKKIFVLLRAQTSHDFSQYKPSTIFRRIERRMAVNQIEAIEDYVKYLQQSAAEVDALFADLLIGVTSFFRDAKTFKFVEDQVIPELFADKPPGQVIRVWSVGCSTGEEAYSIAILLQERMEVIAQSHVIQVFATDIDSRAIATARTGVYPASIAVDMAPGRLARFFTAEPDGDAYRIHKTIRDMLIFSDQDVIKDPPFSRLDLIVCRNLLIYLTADLQKKLMPLFHYALKPGGMLFLGGSEGVGDFSDLYAVLDRNAKVYRRLEDFSGMRYAGMGRLGASLAAPAAPPREAVHVSVRDHKPSLRDLTEQALLGLLASVGVLVNAQGDVLYTHGRSGLFLEPATGEAGIVNVLTMAREGLRPALAAGLHHASSKKETFRAQGLRVKTNGHFTRTDLAVVPVATGAGPGGLEEPSLYLVALEEAPAPRVAVHAPDEGPADPLEPPTTSTPVDADAQIQALLQQLRARDEYVQSAQEELETANEELKSSNEELQSVNEELQSTNEELETSKEELQSVNEELATVNTELQAKVFDLTRVNNDLNNLLAGTGIATVFVDLKLRILRFTPTASQLINLIQTDIGRPVGHIVTNLVGYESLVADVSAVLDTLVPRDREVQTIGGRWFDLRIRPYRTLNNVIEGAVVTFVDITDVKLARLAVQRVEDQHRLASVILRDAPDAIIAEDLNGRILAWNPAAVRLYGWAEAEALQMNGRDRVPVALRHGALSGTLARHRTQRLTKAGALIDIWLTVSVMLNDAGQVVAIATTEQACEPEKV